MLQPVNHESWTEVGWLREKRRRKGGGKSHDTVLLNTLAEGSKHFVSTLYPTFANFSPKKNIAKKR